MSAAQARRPGQGRLAPEWWTAILAVAVITTIVLTSVLFVRGFNSYMAVTLVSDRAGLVLESGSKVKLRGVTIGQVSGTHSGQASVRLDLDIDPTQAQFIPANVEARIEATTAFGAKFVNLVIPSDPSPQRLASGAVVRSLNVTTEVNTVFQNLVGVLDQIDPAKMNSVLSALATSLRGQGERIGLATTAANEVLRELNNRSDTMAEDWRSLKGLTDAYGAAAGNLVTVLDAASTTGETITTQASQLNSALLSALGLSRDGIDLLAPNKDNFVAAINGLRPTFDLVHYYSPGYTCLLQGAKLAVDRGYASVGGNGRTLIVDAALLPGDDIYRYPLHLPKVAAKGGPGGKPGCGSLPDVAQNFPKRYMVTDTGWGGGVDMRPNPGIGHPFYMNYFPQTRAIPEPISVRGDGPPAMGPVPFPGAPPFGAPMYGSGGVPLFPGVPPAPPPPTEPSNSIPAPTPGGP